MVLVLPFVVLHRILHRGRDIASKLSEQPTNADMSFTIYLVMDIRRFRWGAKRSNATPG